MPGPPAHRPHRESVGTQPGQHRPPQRPTGTRHQHPHLVSLHRTGRADAPAEPTYRLPEQPGCPSNRPTNRPTGCPSNRPTNRMSDQPSGRPVNHQNDQPTSRPTGT
ncbi:PT domain-containing protein [Micromonospora rifamycinica]